jgi:hypothetical protein
MKYINKLIKYINKIRFEININIHKIDIIN